MRPPGEGWRIRGCCWLLALLPLVLLSLWFLLFSPDMPYLDQWELPLLIQKMDAGALSFSDLTAQHNEHRILFPRLIMLALARLTHWEVRAELFVNWCLGLLLFGQVCALLRGVGRTTPVSPLLLPLLSLLIFSLSQWQNWFLGWQLQIFLSLNAVVGAVLLLSPERLSVIRGVAALLLAWIATWSFANGLLIWPIGLVLLSLGTGYSQTWKGGLLLIWMLNGLIASLTYLHGFSVPGYHPPLSAALSDPIGVIYYALTYLGQPIAPFSTPLAALLGGAGVLCWGIAGVRLREAENHFVWKAGLGLGAYAFGSALMTALARVELGPAQAMSSRYISIANLLWLAVLPLGSWRQPQEGVGCLDAAKHPGEPGVSAAGGVRGGGLSLDRALPRLHGRA